MSGMSPECQSAQNRKFRLHIPLDGRCSGPAAARIAGRVQSPTAGSPARVGVGRCFHGNLYSYVEHDCAVGDFVTFAPCAKCNGNVHIGDYAYIGSGAVLKQGKPGAPLVIGAGASVGMGATGCAAGVTVVGNPARP
jgi:acyl-[acyl carrier protein]--UDP-N-acetylglucosamine O-acyltransferase